MRTLKEGALQFGWYLMNGGIATALDWSVFAVLRGPYGMDYRAAVTISFICGATCNYELQKHITFGDRVRRGGVQVEVYLVIVGVSLAATVGLMVACVKLGMDGMVARIVTTGMMTAANFLMHRSLTFNRRFLQRLAGDPPSLAG
jgi:putative flippase GtrA